MKPPSGHVVLFVWVPASVRRRANAAAALGGMRLRAFVVAALEAAIAEAALRAQLEQREETHGASEAY